MGAVKEGRRATGRGVSRRGKQLWSVRMFPCVPLSSFSLSQRPTRCTSSTTAFSRAPWYEAAWLAPRVVLFSLPCRVRASRDAPRGNGLSSAPFCCPERSESAHPALPIPLMEMYCSVRSGGTPGSHQASGSTIDALVLRLLAQRPQLH